MSTRNELIQRIAALESERDSLISENDLAAEITHLESRIRILRGEIEQREYNNQVEALWGPNRGANMQAIIDEVNPAVGILPSAELILRRELAEDAIRKAVDAELGAQAGFEDPNIRDREMDKLWSERLPNWETDDPPPLTPEQRAVLEKHIASGVCWPGRRASDELRGQPVAMSWRGDAPPRCYAKRNNVSAPKEGDWCGACRLGPSE